MKSLRSCFVLVLAGLSPALAGPPKVQVTTVDGETKVTMQAGPGNFWLELRRKGARERWVEVEPKPAEVARLTAGVKRAKLGARPEPGQPGGAAVRLDVFADEPELRGTAWVAPGQRPEGLEELLDALAAIRARLETEPEAGVFLACPGPTGLVLEDERELGYRRSSSRIELLSELAGRPVRVRGQIFGKEIRVDEIVSPKLGAVEVEVLAGPAGFVVVKTEAGLERAIPVEQGRELLAACPAYDRLIRVDGQLYLDREGAPNALVIRSVRGQLREELPPAPRGGGVVVLPPGIDVDVLGVEGDSVRVRLVAGGALKTVPARQVLLSR